MYEVDRFYPANLALPPPSPFILFIDQVIRVMSFKKNKNKKNIPSETWTKLGRRFGRKERPN